MLCIVLEFYNIYRTCPPNFCRSWPTLSHKDHFIVGYMREKAVNWSEHSWCRFKKLPRGFQAVDEMFFAAPRSMLFFHMQKLLRECEGIT